MTLGSSASPYSKSKENFEVNRHCGLSAPLTHVDYLKKIFVLLLTLVLLQTCMTFKNRQDTEKIGY